MIKLKKILKKELQERKNISSDKLVVGKTYYAYIIGKLFPLKYVGEKDNRCEFEFARKKDKDQIGIQGPIIRPLKKYVKDIILESAKVKNGTIDISGDIDKKYIKSIEDYLLNDIITSRYFQPLKHKKIKVKIEVL